MAIPVTMELESSRLHSSDVKLDLSAMITSLCGYARAFSVSAGNLP